MPQHRSSLAGSRILRAAQTAPWLPGSPSTAERTGSPGRRLLLQARRSKTNEIRSVLESHRRTIGRSVSKVADPGPQTVHNALLRIDHVVSVVDDKDIRRLPRWSVPRYEAPGSDGEISTYR